MGSKNSNGRKTLALLAATATLAGGLTAGTAYAGGGGGDQGGTGGGGSAAQFWQYKDDASGSWGSATDLGSVSRAMAAAGVRMDDSSGKAKAALDAANVECVAGFHQRHPGEGDGDCRVVAVGAASGNGSTTSVWNGSGVYDAKIWKDNWNKNVAPNTYKYAGTYAYKTSTPFDDDPSNSVDKIMESHVDSTRSIVVIVLDKYQPAPANYDLTVTTTHKQRTDLKVGSTTPIGDTLHASSNGSSIRENLNGTAIIHYEGQKNGYVAAKTVSKPITFANSGDTQLDNLATPADFGMSHWQEGQYWIDIQVAKQGRMNAAVDTADKDPAETWSVSAEPPSPPVKTVDDGVSADSMTNRTVITYGTGKGGYEMAFKDEITADGVDYTVDNYRLVDKSDNDRDVSGEFQIGWDKAANTVTAVRTADKGEMPLDHKYEFSFDVTVSKPKDFKKVKDHATGKWNQEPEADAGSRDFDTWQPNPDKSWIFEQNGRWQAVIDPQETNKTGGDSHTYLDGSRLGSVVNGTIGKNLIQAPKKLVLTDDWTAADYIFDADTKNIRVYEAEAGTDRESSVSDIVNTGKDVTDQFDITVQGTKALAAAKTSYLKGLKGLKNPKQVTLLIPGKINFADGKGAAQVRKDYGKAAGDELTFCTAPNGRDLTNSGSETVNNHTAPTNEPSICGYVPPAKKDVVSEGSQGGDQESVDGKVVYPGQKVEYQLNTQPQLPADLAYAVESISFTDSYDAYLNPDKQTLEMMDLNTGKPVSKKKYTTKWDDEKHMFTLTVTDQETISQWRAGTSPRLQVRFEGTVSDDAPTDHKVGNKWMLTLNNSLTPSNEVFNIPPKLDPKKKDTQKDPTVSIDGKTALLGDEIYYRVDIDATQTDQAYKVWRFGMTDDYDDEYLKLDATKVEITDETGKDVTGRFNIQDKGGVLYAYAKLVDTEIPATGETVKGDPQPEDLKAYSESDEHDPLTQPAIDQTLLGHTYTVTMPMTVVKVTDGYTVKNKATQVLNKIRKDTNEVTNPLKPINPAKDVTVKVGGESIDGKSVYLNRTFLYQLDSSIIPAGRAYPQVDQWRIVDPLNTEYDQYTGQWAVYASRDLYRDGKVIAAKGDKLAGNGFDSSKFGGDLFTAAADANGVVTVEATEAYRTLVSADNEHEAGWRAYIQCKRLKVSDRVENRFTEYFNNKEFESNVVWTRTPDMTPSIHIEKYDVASGEQAGDRDDVKDALKMAGDSQQIAFKITNTSKTDSSTGEGAWYLAKDLKMVDRTIAGEGDVTDLKYPDNWATLVLKPGESTIITGTLKGVEQGGKHTDRVKVTGTPLVECPVTDQFGGQQSTDGNQTGDTKVDGDASDTTGLKQVKVGDRTLCEDTTVESNTDDWSGYREDLATTGAAIAGILLAVVAFGSIGVTLMGARRRTAAASHAAHSGK
ncbi:peptidase [Bifidobacterium pseudocatenulatum]|uniref:LPXTG cell wall anchor domain-containing protein n=2 Tax=Bifidobacterium pseudocatenulatum TaxID=28026 RepID=UPI000E55CF36|nr:LPXTG cell wall anchor domain-containing protein [Bifidobacterium pseudocatenulatum]RHJ81991.1 peptidase [Bifidobacterium pseudocatenulatum]